MTYLSYIQVDGIPVATPADAIDASTKFQVDGNLYTCAYPGFNVQILGSTAPGGRLVFQRAPIYTPGYDRPAGDFGVLVPQSDGTVAIQWPV